MIRLAIFVVATGGIAWISRKSLLVPTAHGFHRFWAWEAIVALILVVIPDWFREPFALHQIVAWVLLAASLVVGIPGVRALQARGKVEGPAETRAGEVASPKGLGSEMEPQHHSAGVGRDTLYAFEKTTALVTTGIYRYIRHPMYASLFYLAWGAFFKSPALWAGALVLTATLFLHLTARCEEAEDIAYFGVPYRDYMTKTKRFIPFVY